MKSMCYMEDCKAQQDIMALKDGMASLQKDMRRVITAIMGDEKMGVDGVVQTIAKMNDRYDERMNEEEDEILKLKTEVREIDKKITWASGFSAAFGGAIGFFTSILTLK